MSARTKRSRWIAASMLALIATGALCVFGAAVAGLEFNTPFFTLNFGNNGGFDLPIFGGGPNGGGGGNGGDGGNDGGDVKASNELCLLGLICITQNADVAADVNTDAATNTGVEIDVNADTDEDGLNLDADASVDGITEADCRALDVNADGVLNVDDNIESQNDVDVAAFCDDIGFSVD